MDDIKITYAILTQNEKQVFEALDSIYANKGAEDNVVVLADGSSKEHLARLSSYKGIKVVSHKLQHSFSDHRNTLLPYLTGDYTFWLDSDEQPTPYLFLNIKRILKLLTPDLLWLPRANQFKGAPQHLCNPDGFLNWPDYQGRIVRNAAGLKWHKNLHEQIKAEPNTKQVILSQHRDFAVTHSRDFQDVVKTNQLYQQKYSVAENKGLK